MNQRLRRARQKAVVDAAETRVDQMRAIIAALVQRLGGEVSITEAEFNILNGARLEDSRKVSEDGTKFISWDLKLNYNPQGVQPS